MLIIATHQTQRGLPLRNVRLICNAKTEQTLITSGCKLYITSIAVCPGHSA
jgi:hypothetical protein